MTNKEIAYQFWSHMTKQQFDKLAALFHNDAIIKWPNTQEIFNVEQFILANAKYPGNWKGNHRELL